MDEKERLRKEVLRALRKLNKAEKELQIARFQGIAPTWALECEDAAREEYIAACREFEQWT
jgi:hypothetical protein